MSDVKFNPNARYTKTHEWITKEGDLFLVGISDHAQAQLSDLVYVELPAVGKTFKQGEPLGVLESVKAATDIYMPIDGEVVEVNEALPDEPGKINEDAFGAWLIKIKAGTPAQFDALMDVEAYKQHAASEAH
jgi:glycine cleavage system H protein